MELILTIIETAFLRLGFRGQGETKHLKITSACLCLFVVPRLQVSKLWNKYICLKTPDFILFFKGTIFMFHILPLKQMSVTLCRSMFVAK